MKRIILLITIFFSIHSFAQSSDAMYFRVKQIVHSSDGGETFQDVPFTNNIYIMIDLDGKQISVNTSVSDKIAYKILSAREINTKSELTILFKTINMQNELHTFHFALDDGNIYLTQGNLSNNALTFILEQ